MRTSFLFFLIFCVFFGVLADELKVAKAETDGAVCVITFDSKKVEPLKVLMPKGMSLKKLGTGLVLQDTLGWKFSIGGGGEFEKIRFTPILIKEDLGWKYSYTTEGAALGGEVTNLENYIKVLMVYLYTAECGKNGKTRTGHRQYKAMDGADLTIFWSRDELTFLPGRNVDPRATLKMRAKRGDLIWVTEPIEGRENYVQDWKLGLDHKALTFSAEPEGKPYRKK